MAFQDATRQNIRSVGNLVYAVNERRQLILPRVGFLKRLLLTVAGVATATGGTIVLTSTGPWSLIGRIRFTANQGQEIFSVSGFGAMICDTLGMLKNELTDGQTGAAYATSIYNAPGASGANTWRFGLNVDITPNPRDMAGIILLQTEGLQAALAIDWVALVGTTIDFPTALGTASAGSFAGSCDVVAETFTVPAAIEDMPPITTLWQTLEQSVAVGGVGDTRIQLLRANAYARIIHIVVLNAALNTNDVTNLMLRYNNSEIPYNWPAQAYLTEQRRRYGLDLPVGVFVHDLYYQGFPGFGAGRDLVDAYGVAELESIVTVAGGAVLGANNNFIRTITQQFVNLGAPQM